MSKPEKKRAFLILGVMAVAVVSLYSLYWWSLAENLKSALTNWLHDRASKGYVAKVENIQVNGFPDQIILVVEKPQLGGKELEAAPWLWQGVEMKISTLPWRPNRYSLSLSGKQYLSFAYEGKPYEYRGAAKSVHIESDMSLDGFPSDAEVKVNGLNLVSLNDAPPLSIGKLNLGYNRNREGNTPEEIAQEVTFEAEAVSAPNIFQSPFGGQFNRVVFSGRQMGPIANRRPLLTQIINWRDSGGIIEVDQLALDHGPVILTASGTVALDREMQPTAAFSSRTFGFFEAVDALRDKGMIRPGDATMAKLVLGVVSSTAGDGERRRLDLPISVQNRAVYTGPVRLVNIASLDWSFVENIEAVLTP